MEHTHVLTELTTIECNRDFPLWLPHHEEAFKEIKKAVMSRECLTTIDYNLMPGMKIFMTMDASDYQSGAMLSFGKDWESA